MRHSPGLKTRPTYAGRTESKDPACVRRLSDYFLDVALSLLLPDVPGRHERVVLEEDQIFAVDSLPDEPLLERERLHRKQVEPENPRVLDVRGRRNEIGREDRGPATRLDEHDLMVARVASAPHDTDTWPDFLIAVVERHDACRRERNEIVGHV